MALKHNDEGSGTKACRDPCLCAGVGGGVGGGEETNKWIERQSWRGSKRNRDTEDASNWILTPCQPHRGREGGREGGERDCERDCERL